MTDQEEQSRWLEKYLTKPGARYYREEALAEYRQMETRIEHLEAALGAYAEHGPHGLSRQQARRALAGSTEEGS